VLAEIWRVSPQQVFSQEWEKEEPKGRKWETRGLGARTGVDEPWKGCTSTEQHPGWSHRSQKANKMKFEQEKGQEGGLWRAREESPS
jgi:hypothetical protein